MQGPAGNGVLEQARGQGYRTSKMRMGPGTSNSRAISAPRHGAVGERATSPEADESQSQKRNLPLLVPVAVCSQDQNGHLGGQGC